MFPFSIFAFFCIEHSVFLRYFILFFQDLVHLIADAYYYSVDLDSSKRDAMSSSMSTSTASLFGSLNTSSSSIPPASTSSKIIFTEESSSSSLDQNTVIRRRGSTSSVQSSSLLSTQKSNSSSVLLNSITSVTEYEKNDDDESAKEAVLVREVGHNLYILAHKLARFNKELNVLLRSNNTGSTTNTTTYNAFSYYASRTAQIEVMAFVTF